MDKVKTLNVTFGLLYYILGIVGFFYLFILCGIFGIIESFSQELFFICFLLFPIIILLLPIIITKIFKKVFYKSILWGLMMVVVYFLILLFIRYSILRYMGTFTIEKWNHQEYYHLRYLMIEDLEDKYHFVGKNKEEVIRVLGTGNEYDHNICYFVKSEWLDSYDYCLHYDEDNIITDTYQTYGDF